MGQQMRWAASIQLRWMAGALGILLVASVAFALWLAFHRSATTIGSFGPSAYALHSDDASFRPLPVPSGVLSSAEALKAAGGFPHHLLEPRDVQHSLVFGAYSNRFNHDRRAWILSTRGFWFVISHGPPRPENVARHEINVAIDAETGSNLEEFGF